MSPRTRTPRSTHQAGPQEGHRVNEELVDRIVRRIAHEVGLSATGELAAARRAEIIREEAGVISDHAVLELLRTLRHESEGIGALEPLLSLQGLTDIVVNGPDDVWFDRGQGMEKSPLVFEDEAHVRSLATRLALACGRRLDDAAPYCDGRILRDDGSAIRVHAVLSPPADGGTCISLRVLRSARLGLGDLLDKGMMPEGVAAQLADIVHNRQAFLIAGGTGSGKTTLLAAMLTAVAPTERIICIEDTAELSPTHPHVVTMVARNNNVEGTGEITLSDLLKQALRMRPDRIVVGEIRGAEVVDLLAALNTGHEGGAGTLHANSIHEIPARIEALAALGGLDREAAHAQLRAAVDVVISVARTREGRIIDEIGRIEGPPLRIRSIWKAGETEYEHRLG